ncbi:class I SAM-dependent DNA methyltransferase [Priestia aryabhattai]|uniref:DNA methyltransferase n=1 Tax=Priestia TaxID=2800373 RepID=UPI001C8EC517|nr:MULTISPECIES: DNA methyltransferase [Priestia]MBY0005733.1 class I SAM-dependent DNA methyltransferase [Priestia aryabhattai]MBY0047586.1 class I SAM-dependent DNA methyltransferase [Priestia aryabhattai]MDH3186675.1 N-6 DNA methylase [Priestia megaterium]
MSKRKKLEVFVEWFKNYCIGDEKGEAQIFLDRLFQGFGHDGILDVGGKAEFRIKKKKGTSFADLVWKPTVLIEMKKRGTDLSKHYEQAEEYWMNLVPNRPKYVVLCNFDEFWIYDLNRQLFEPVDKVKTEDLPKKWGPLAFLFPKHEAEEPVFNNDLIEVTASAADKVAGMYKSLVSRGIEKEDAQRFSLQCVLSMFAEDIELLPKYMFTRLVEECLHGKSSYDLLGDLFIRMNQPGIVPHGKYKGVDYFNGGLFSKITHIELNSEELAFLQGACQEDWSKVKPAIFGVLFEDSMDKEARHAFGAHYTSEADIMKIIRPTIVNPWMKQIKEAKTLKELYSLLEKLRELKILDPSCGSGNFLYVAYIELKKIEKEIYININQLRKKNKYESYNEISFITAKQFYGFDVNSFAVELAKVTLMIAKKLAFDEFKVDEIMLPLDNLDENIFCADALFIDWPDVDVIIGNPPYQSKNKMQKELGVEYLNRLRQEYSRIPGHADYCVYWFRKTHEILKPGGRAGLVGTNTIRENYSRIGGLDYIVQNGGTITEAVSNQSWSGDAAVNVSIVNWIKGTEDGKKKLYIEREGNLEIIDDIEYIPSTLSKDFVVTKAKVLKQNQKVKCYQGQTHGHESFLLTEEESKRVIELDNRNKEVIYPFLIANELFGNNLGKPTRYVMDFYPKSMIESQRYKEPFKLVKENVLPTREENFRQEQERNKLLLHKDPNASVNRHHQNFYNSWWLLSYSRGELLQKLSNLSRYIVCSQVTKRPIFEFVHTDIRPNASLIVFPFDDDYSFGILQSFYHWSWFKAKGSTLTERYRYTSTTIFNTFPWPQNPTDQDIENVAKASRKLRDFRWDMMKKEGLTLRELYRSLELPGKNQLRNLHLELDSAVRKAYKFNIGDPLVNLLDLNLKLSKLEAEGKEITGPGLPSSISNRAKFISEDSITI